MDEAEASERGYSVLVAGLLVEVSSLMVEFKCWLMPEVSVLLDPLSSTSAVLGAFLASLFFLLVQIW